MCWIALWYQSWIEQRIGASFFSLSTSASSSRSIANLGADLERGSDFLRETSPATKHIEATGSKTSPTGREHSASRRQPALSPDRALPAAYPIRNRYRSDSYSLPDRYLTETCSKFACAWFAVLVLRRLPAKLGAWPGAFSHGSDTNSGSDLP